MTAVEPRPASAPADIGAFAYFEGSVVPIGDAKVSIATHTFNYGTAVFEGIRAYRQADGSLAILFALEHYERMLRNARLVRASVPESAEDLVEITRDLLRRNAHDGDAYIRPLVYKSARSIRVKLTGLDDRVGIFTIPLGDYLPTGGIRLTVSGWQRVSDNAIPARGKISGSYVNAAFAAEDAHAAGYDDAILLTGDGHVAEASAANLFVVAGSEVATPPLTDDVLAGITRSAIMQHRGRRRPRGRRAPDRPLRAVPRRRGVPDRHRRPGGAGLVDRRPCGRQRRVPDLARHPAPLLRRRARQRRALRALAHPDLTVRRAVRPSQSQGDPNR